MSSLSAFLKRYIEKNGPITVADYMQFALGHPDYGYYTTHANPIGQKGDFVTAPEMSQIFGELVGLWFLYIWQQCFKDQPSHFVELGPGQGTIMADALRTWKKLDPSFLSKTDLHLVESHIGLQAMQAAQLKNHKVEWHPGWPALSPHPTFILANEFFDALPIRQFVHQQDNWYERLIGWHQEEQKLCFINASSPSTDRHLIPTTLQDAPNGSFLEASPASWLYLQTMLDHLKISQGVLLIIDYGNESLVTAPTLQAVKQHHYCDVLQDPGEVDLSAHVAFGALKQIAQQNNAQCFGPVCQGEWLEDMGIAYRLQQLIQANPHRQQELDQAVRRLCHPNQMGALFKVMAIGYNLPDQLPGFA